VSSTSVFVGHNLGEWGGGLIRIDRGTGAVVRIERNDSGDLCGGPLNSECDPVNGIAATLGNPGCVVVAIGLVHFKPHGRLVEVCGEQVRRLYFKPVGTDRNASRRKRDEPFSTIAFFGLAHSGESLVAVGIDGLYRLHPDGTVTFASLPAFRSVGDIRVSFAVRDVILVFTEVNRRRSISGAVPMLVPR